MTTTDRRAAGRALADRLLAFRGPDVVLLVTTHGGVAVAAGIAAALRVPLEVMAAPGLRLEGRTVVLVEDAIAEAGPARSAIAAAYRDGAARVVLAAPVATRPAVDALTEIADKIVCLELTDALDDVDGWYPGDRPPTDAEVRQLLARSSRRSPAQDYVALTMRTFPWPAIIGTRRGRGSPISRDRPA